MFGKLNSFASKARVSACMYFLVKLTYSDDQCLFGLKIKNSSKTKFLVPFSDSQRSKAFELVAAMSE
jgi:hypothetical protein